MAERASQAWKVVQIGELIRELEQLYLDLMQTVGLEASASMGERATITLDRDETQRLAERVEASHDLTDELCDLVEHLSKNHTLHVTFDDAREGAAADFQNGILDARRAMLAARLLNRERGFAALAGALRSSDATAAWGSTTLETILSAFRNVDTGVREQVAHDAHLAPGATLAACAPDELVTLATVLERHATPSDGDERPTHVS